MLFLFLASDFFSQKLDVKAYFAAYQNEPYVCLSKTAKAEITVVKEQLQVIQHQHEELLILKNNLNSFRNRKIRTSGFVTIKNVKANILVYNGKSHSREKITTIDLAAENNNEDTFYDGGMFYNIKFNSAKEGDIIEIDYDEVFAEPRFFDIFFVSDYSTVIHSDLTLSYPPGLVNLKIKELNNQHIAMHMKTDSTKKLKTLSWVFDSVPALTDEYADVCYKEKASYILMNIESYRTKDSVVKLAGTLDNLYHWYRSLIKNVDLSKDEQLVNLTDSITSGQPNDLEKLRQIFYWVQSKIAYLAYEDGLGGYVPREAAIVCSRRFGDCKDMANLIVRMGRIAKLPVYPAWIGTRDIPFQFTEFPAPFCANHMIAVYVSATDTIFLDATGKKHPFRLPTSMIQGKEALVGIDSVRYLVAKVPYINKNLTVEHDSLVLTIQENNRIKGSGYYTLTGYQKISLTNYLEKKDYNTQKNYLKEVLEKGNNKFKLDTFYIVQQDIEKPLVIRYNFLISDYLTQNGDLTYINLNFLKGYFDGLSVATRKNSIHFTYKTINKLSVNINLEGKYKVDFLPQNSSFNNSTLGFELFYSSKGNSVSFSNAISINETTITDKEFKDADFIMSNYRKNRTNLLSLTLKK